jgi:hypothetical protein
MPNLIVNDKNITLEFQNGKLHLKLVDGKYMKDSEIPLCTD